MAKIPNPEKPPFASSSPTSTAPTTTLVDCFPGGRILTMHGDGDKVRIRQTWGQQAWQLALLAFLLVWNSVLGIAGAAFFVACAVWFGVILLDRFWVGITLTPDAAIVHNLRSRVIPWSAIQDVTIETFRGSRTIVLREAQRRTRLRAPVSAFRRGSRFEEEYRLIIERRLAHGDKGWLPSRPAPPEPVVWVPPRS